jgi:hypothetical protein
MTIVCFICVSEPFNLTIFNSIPQIFLPVATFSREFFDILITDAISAALMKINNVEGKILYI